MRTYRLERGLGVEGLKVVTGEPPALGAREVRVRVHAVSLNHRDFSQTRASSGDAITPVSDGAGEVVEVGAEVRRFNLGDRVMASFFPDWVDGPPDPAKTARPLGGRAFGMLAESVALPEHSWTRIPEHLSYREAATLPCAGVTAWNALFVTGELRPGSTVLVLGTGGVSLWALQLARVAGLRAIVTSSDDAKLEGARALGAGGTINYRKVPEWDVRVRELTGGRGVDLVLETVGRETLGRSLRSLRAGGMLAKIGGVSGFGGEIDDDALIDGALRIAGVLVGSRSMLDDLARFVGDHNLRPVIDRAFGFDDAPSAYRHFAAARNPGKVVIDVAAA